MREWSQGELKVISIVPRVAASIGLASAAVLGFTAYRHIRRQRCQQQQQQQGGGGGTRSLLYHRFMVALSCHLCLFSAANVVGTAAIPAGTTNTWGARGTTGTCSAQGFVLQLSLTAPFYYVLLSLYSFLAVWHNFSVEKYTWVEPWIHVGVHVFPVGSAIYLLSLEAYNQPGEHPGTTCWIDSLPFGCGDGGGGGGNDDGNDPNNSATVPCTRGPQNISQVAGIFAGLPVLFIMVFPVLVMSALVWQVVRHQARIQISATAVAKQAAVYIGALYWSYALTIIGHTRGWKANETDSMALQLGGTITMNLIGFWFLLIYFYFWMPSTSNSTQQQQQQQASNESSLPNHAQSVPPPEKCRTTTTATSRSTSPRTIVVPAFNIFDGTNATGEFADYIYDGDSEDERVDQAESLHWNDIQNHV